MQALAGGVDGVIAVQHPVAYVDVGCAGLDLAHDRCVAVAEHAVVEMLAGEALIAVLHDAFAVVAKVVQSVLAGMFDLVAVAPVYGNSEGEPRRQQGEHTLAETVVEYAPDAVERLVGAVQAVAVADEEAFAVELHGNRLLVLDEADFAFEVVESPHIMVAGEEMHLDAAIGQLGELAEQTHVAAWHDIAVREPEIEHIAEQHEGVAAVLDGVEETAQFPFTLGRVGAAAEVGVGDKIEVLAHGVRFYAASRAGSANWYRAIFGN